MQASKRTFNINNKSSWKLKISYNILFIYICITFCWWDRIWEWKLTRFSYKLAVYAVYVSFRPLRFEVHNAVWPCSWNCYLLYIGATNKYSWYLRVHKMREIFRYTFSRMQWRFLLLDVVSTSIYPWKESHYFKTLIYSHNYSLMKM
jgi:hypothetical protein